MAVVSFITLIVTLFTVLVMSFYGGALIGDNLMKATGIVSPILVCLTAIVMQYAYSRDDKRLAGVRAAFSASACTWAPALACRKYAVASVRSTGLLSMGFILIFLDVPHNPAYWAAPSVLVLQHVGYDLGWWAKDYCNRDPAKHGMLLLS